MNCPPRSAAPASMRIGHAKPRDVESVCFFCQPPLSACCQFGLCDTTKMSRDDEDRILHGLYWYRENIDEDVQVSSEQLLWLAMHPLGDRESWSKYAKLQSLVPSEFPEKIRGKLR